MKPVEQISTSMRPPATAMMIALSGLMVMASIMVLTGDPMFTRDAAERAVLNIIEFLSSLLSEYYRIGLD